MRWSDAIDEAFAPFISQEEPPAIKPAPPRQAPAIHSCCCVVRQPSGDGDLGEALDCYWYVSDGAVVLCNQRGNATGEEQRLAPGDDPRAVAIRLRRSAWRQQRDATERVPGFGRPLRYGVSGLE